MNRIDRKLLKSLPGLKEAIKNKDRLQPSTSLDDPEGEPLPPERTTLDPPYADDEEE